MMIGLMTKPTDGILIGARMKAERERLGWSQEQLAIRARVNRNWVASLEAGNTDEPSAVRLLAAANAMGVELHYLLTGERPAGQEPDERDPFLHRLRAMPIEVVRFATETADNAVERLGKWLEPHVEQPIEQHEQRDAGAQAQHEHEQPETEGPESAHTASQG